jgi:hypothetical protein
MTCSHCGAQNTHTAKSCVSCGAFLGSILKNDKLVHYGAAGLGLVIGACILLAIWETHTFNSMTAAQHLAEAKRMLVLATDPYSESGVQEAFRHLAAIPPNDPLVSEANNVKSELLAKQAAAQRAELQTQQVRTLALLRQKQADEARVSVIRELQEKLRNLGYDLTVTRSEKPDEIVITSADFGDTDHRVRFLSFLRGRNGPTADVCLAGFQTVRLQGTGWRVFSEQYSLECFNAK